MPGFITTVRYTVIGGEVIAEKRGGVRRLYVPDALGSTVALVDNTQTKTDTFTYWPYGEEKARTGTTPTPFRFVGTAGYYRDSANRTYVRARYLRPDVGRWLTQDPINLGGNDLNLYRYGSNNPASFNDPQGLRVVGGGRGSSCPGSCGFFSPRTHEGRIFIACNCKGADITILPDEGDVNTKPQCGQWISADAVIIGGVTYKVNGQTCSVVTCDNGQQCTAPYFDCLECSTIARISGKCVAPYQVDYCREFCGSSCPPPCRGRTP